MDVVHACCAGLDVHKRTVVACVLRLQPDGSVLRQVRTFATMTAELLALDDWLSAQGVERVALESTGVYWRPVYTLIEEGRTIVLVNPQHMKAVPGRKTDVKDAEWLADLLQHGLLRASFIPPAPVRALRELTRHRRTLVQQRVQVVNRIQKVLESANLKLASVASNVLGASGRAMLDALVAGTDDPAALAELARGRLRAKRAELRAALEGRVQAHQRFLLQQLLAQIDFLDVTIAQVQVEIDQHVAPFAEAVALAQTIPGVAHTAAVALIGELGADMSAFPSHKHLASWAGLCPGNKQSGGKRLSGQTTPGNPRLKALLCEVAQAIAHTKNNYLTAQYHRLARRRGKGRAILALAHSVLVILYHVLRDHRPYTDLGADYFERLDTVHLQRRYVRRLEQLGYAVTLTPSAVA
jgi:transposase